MPCLLEQTLEPCFQLALLFRKGASYVPMATICGTSVSAGWGGGVGLRWGQRGGNPQVLGRQHPLPLCASLPPLVQEVSLSPLHPTQLDNLWAVAAAHCHFVCSLPLNIAVLQGRKASSCPLMLGLSVSPMWLLFHPFPSHIPHTPCLSGKGQW